MRKFILGVGLLVFTSILLAAPAGKVIIPEECTPEKDVFPERGFILYFDHVSRFLEDPVVQKLRKERYFDYLSLDEYTLKLKVSYYTAAHTLLRQAVDLARKGRKVLLDSVIIRDYFELEKDVDIVTMGVLCPLKCIKKRMEEKLGKKGTYWEERTITEYNFRYKNMKEVDILNARGLHFFNADKMVRYDLFYDTKTVNAHQVIHDLNEVLFKKERQRAERDGVL